MPVTTAARIRHATPTLSDEDYDVNHVGFQVGQYVRNNPYDGLDDDQAAVLQKELEAQEARRHPFGFRATG